MKTTISLVMVLTLCFSTAAQANKDEAVRVYKEYACDGCHSITAHSIPVVERDVGEKNVDGRVPPDLSKVGEKRDAEWISRWLQKKEELNGKPHKRMFKGSKEERDALTTWLATLK